MQETMKKRFKKYWVGFVASLILFRGSLKYFVEPDISSFHHPTFHQRSFDRPQIILIKDVSKEEFQSLLKIIILNKQKIFTFLKKITLIQV